MLYKIYESSDQYDSSTQVIKYQNITDARHSKKQYAFSWGTYADLTFNRRQLTEKQQEFGKGLVIKCTNF